MDSTEPSTEPRPAVRPRATQIGPHLGHPSEPGVEGEDLEPLAAYVSLDFWTGETAACGPAGRVLGEGGARPLEQLPHGREKDLGRKRLLQERNGWAWRAAAMKDVRGGVCRYVEHRHCRAINRETPAKLPPVHSRHDYVGHYETKMGRRQVRQVERLPAVPSLQYAVAPIRQKPDHQPAQDLLVVCDEDGDRALGYRMRLSHN
jgi:hypothetical protein